MALAMNPLNGTSHHYQEKLGYDGKDEDDCYNILEDQLTFKENPRIKAIIDGREHVSQLNSPVQLYLLPLTPVLRDGPLLWSSDNGSFDGCSSGKRKGFDVNSMVVAPAGIEEATSSLRQDYSSYVRTRNVIGKMEFDGRNDTGELVSRASDEDENGIYRKKLRLSKQQSGYLEESFKDHSTLNCIQKLELAKKLNLSPRQVEVWFQNRRARHISSLHIIFYDLTKLKQTEVNCEYLKKYCETLRGENRRLNEELQELRALKTTSNPSCLQLPATTTLTMYPSCVQVAATTFTTTTTTSAFHSAPPPPSTANTNLRDSTWID
ncbi:Homeodomain-containing protein [Cynara cardunculus var. scolymus]|uniref:Homeodomain-containing protein n=1 Tax=Cynara cardunculus var. scolymus TaxID=59895 RepID=A0A103XES7_CYNCS|nr:Homeodomain-containing protein [Cynara cardunculus var. scolymus]